ncbi:TIGR03086 family protein [Nocardia uniformis]|uniref:TIGR03086 family protein n=1 Tax=Nocardia uniformis TaxID=53432 RepID=A0A849CEM2_9NOCA|nr:TIGR03086 family metal-binding protein [Nocardia uniformis]NNH74797.1 TIGR03086 family protein [Nocardia uniformis]
MTTTPPVDDPRPVFARAVDQAEKQVEAVRPDELGNSTPCADYDVRALLGHMISVLYKIARVGAGGDAREIADVIDGIADTDWADAFTKARSDVERVWAADEMLDRMVTLPWATLPGRVALDAYTHEFTAHAWDLAHATGRLSELDPDLAVRALDAFPKFAPPETRSGQGPFGPAIAVSADADAYIRLAAYLGRRPGR